MIFFYILSIMLSVSGMFYMRIYSLWSILRHTGPCNIHMRDTNNRTQANLSVTNRTGSIVITKHWGAWPWFVSAIACWDLCYKIRRNWHLRIHRIISKHSKQSSYHLVVIEIRVHTCKYDISKAIFFYTSHFWKPSWKMFMCHVYRKNKNYKF